MLVNSVSYRMIIANKWLYSLALWEKQQSKNTLICHYQVPMWQKKGKEEENQRSHVQTQDVHQQHTAYGVVSEAKTCTPLNNWFQRRWFFFIPFLHHYCYHLRLFQWFFLVIWWRGFEYLLFLKVKEVRCLWCVHDASCNLKKWCMLWEHIQISSIVY